VTGVIFENGPNVVVAQRRGAPRVVSKDFSDTTASIHPIETAVKRAHPQSAALILEDLGDLVAAERLRICSNGE